MFLSASADGSARVLRERGGARARASRGRARRLKRPARQPALGGCRLQVESREHLVAVGAVRAQHAVEVLAVHLHHRHQQLGRRDAVGAALIGDPHGLLGDERDGIAWGGVLRRGARAGGARVVLGDRHLADAQRLQRRADFAVQAQHAQPALGLVFAACAQTAARSRRSRAPSPRRARTAAARSQRHPQTLAPARRRADAAARRCRGAGRAAGGPRRGAARGSRCRLCPTSARAAPMKRAISSGATP